ncbi:MAG: PD-(D/E)XK nuclease family protein, partial [Clostridia bacterium]
FMMETTLTGAERGTALHAWMHCMDLEPLRVCSPEGMGAVLQADLARVTAIGVLAAEAAETIDVAQVTAFWQSSLGARALRAKELHREWPFNLRSEDQGQRILVQGVIDCCFVEEGAWILIDYKTDHVEAVPQTLAQHAPQLAYYAEALRKITRLPVREKIVYLFATGRAYTL